MVAESWSEEPRVSPGRMPMKQVGEIKLIVFQATTYSRDASSFLRITDLFSSSCVASIDHNTRVLPPLKVTTFVRFTSDSLAVTFFCCTSQKFLRLRVSPRLL